ncbi:MAG TPA: hypothetical protein VMD29_12110 [Terracidiphilus sp.]|nr:hypothetical protein [Terracidiphilus sp.]
MSFSDNQRLEGGLVPAAQNTPMTREESREYWTRTGILIVLSIALFVVPAAALLRFRSYPEVWHRLVTGSGLTLLLIIFLVPLLFPSMILAKWLWRKARRGSFLPSSEEFQAFKARQSRPQPAWKDVLLGVIFGAEAIHSGFRALHASHRPNWGWAAAAFCAAAALLFAGAGIGKIRWKARLARMPRRDGFACPKCGAKPPIGPLWGCRVCGKPFDTFATHTVCPHCSASHDTTMCISCKASSPIDDWERAASNPQTVLVNGMPLPM